MRKRHPSEPLGWIALGLVGAIVGVASNESAAPTQGVAQVAEICQESPQAYGCPLTVDQQAALQYLAWPQSYEAISNRFGYPDRRTSTTDYYNTGNGEIGITYNGTQATGLE